MGMSAVPVFSAAQPPLSNAEQNRNSDFHYTGGRRRRMVLTNRQRKKRGMNLSGTEFYKEADEHVDSGFIHTLTQLYREKIPPASRVLDLMTSRHTHLPAEISYSKVVGHGFNALELSRNRLLDSFFVKDINVGKPRFELLDDCSFDAVLCANRVQYVEQPERVFAEIYRLLRPGGVCIVSFTNTMMFEKVVAAWRDGSASERIQLVVDYFDSVAGFGRPEVVKRMPGRGCEQQFVTMDHFNMFRTPSCHPFYAVTAFRTNTRS